MLTRVEIENFKAIEKLSMEFGSRLTVIVGPNGSGKTSILQAIASVNGKQEENNLLEFRRLGCTQNPSVGLAISQGSIRFDPDTIPNNTKQLQNIGVVQQIDIPFVFFLRCDYDELTYPSLATSRLHSDASNLSAVLASLKLNDPERFDLIETSFRKVIPQIIRIRFDQAPVRGFQLVSTGRQLGGFQEMPTSSNVASGFRLLLDTTHTIGIPAGSASEGTLLSLAIITAVVMPETKDEAIVLIDDLDAALHPSAQKALIDAIRKLLDCRPNLQIIATSHSPYLLHSLEFDEVRLTTLRDDGTVACGRLLDHPEFERWKDEMTPGEMWSMFGEKWLADRPNPEPVA